LPPAQIIVLADLRDPAVFHDNGAIAPTAEGPEVRGINEEPADSEWAGVRLHDLAGDGGSAVWRAGLPKKRIRAAHAEKQQIQETCGRPNRLNLTDLTSGGRPRSKYFWKFYNQIAKRRTSLSKNVPALAPDHDLNRNLSASTAELRIRSKVKIMSRIGCSAAG
jgi:hypothetical protein